MKTKLERIENAEKQRALLQAELREMNIALGKNRIRQQQQILGGNDPSNFEIEIARLQIKIQGHEGAIKSLDSILQELDKTEAIEERQTKLKQVKQLGDECFKLIADIYRLFADIVKKLGELQAKKMEYYSAAKGFSKEEQSIHIVRNFVYALRKEINGMLTGFPRIIFNDGTLPDLKELLATLKRVS